MLQQPQYDIGPYWSSSENTDVQLNVNVGCKHFQIDLFTDNFNDNRAFLDECLLHVRRLDPAYVPDITDDAQNDEFTDPLEDMHDWALKPFLPLFHEVPPIDLNQNYSLRDCLFREKVRYTLHVAKDQMIPILLDERHEDRPVGALFSPSERAKYYSMFPIYRPDEIFVPICDNSSALPTQPGKVSIRGEQLCFFKQVLAGDIASTIREFSAYANIQSAGFGPEVLTSRLYGVVEDEETSRVIGLLLSYIDCQSQTLYCARRHLRYPSLRKKWLDQIVSTLRHLHAHQITWGDGKPANILIDVHDDAYLIDFGGGYTQGWVNKALSNTIEGDLQALERIINYLSE
jgi:hypothetical protein